MWYMYVRRILVNIHWLYFWTKWHSKENIQDIFFLKKISAPWNALIEEKYNRLRNIGTNCSHNTWFLKKILCEYHKGLLRASWKTGITILFNNLYKAIQTWDSRTANYHLSKLEKIYIPKDHHNKAIQSGYCTAKGLVENMAKYFSLARSEGLSERIKLMFNGKTPE